MANRAKKIGAPRIGIVMGSSSDWETLRHAAALLGQFGVPFEAQVVSAHRTPDLLWRYAKRAAARRLACIIAGGGAAAFSFAVRRPITFTTQKITKATIRNWITASITKPARLP